MSAREVRIHIEFPEIGNQLLHRHYGNEHRQHEGKQQGLVKFLNTRLLLLLPKWPHKMWYVSPQIITRDYCEHLKNYRMNFN